MGIIKTELTLVNPYDLHDSLLGNRPPEEVRKVDVSAIVDTGATRMVINEEIFEILGILRIETVDTLIADGSYRTLPLSDGVLINFQNRSTLQRAVIAPRGSKILLGAIPLQDLDVVINMQKECIEVNPESPDIQSCLLL